MQSCSEVRQNPDAASWAAAATQITLQPSDSEPSVEVIVLDEIEKAHSDFARALLTVFGEYGCLALSWSV